MSAFLATLVLLTHLLGQRGSWEFACKPVDLGPQPISLSWWDVSLDDGYVVLATHRYMTRYPDIEGQYMVFGTGGLKKTGGKWEWCEAVWVARSYPLRVGQPR